MMKRLIALLLIAMAVLCVGCGEEPEPTTAPPTEESTTEAPTTETTEPTTEATEPPTMANDLFDPVASAGLIDTWSVDVVLDGTLLNFPDMEGSVTMKLSYQLRDDATYTRGVEAAEYEAAIAEYENLIRSYMLGRRYATFAAEKKLEGKKDDEIKQLWEQTGWPQAMAEIEEFVSGLHLGYRFSALNRSGDYYAAEVLSYPFEEEPTLEATPELLDMLYFSKDDGTYEACAYEQAGSELTLLSSTDPNTYTQLKLEFPLTLTNGTAETEPTEATEAEQD